MEPIKFKEQTVIYAEDQDQYGNLPSHKTKDEHGIVTSCWKLSWKERLCVLIHGKVWMQLWSFNKPLTPSLLSAKKPTMEDQ